MTKISSWTFKTSVAVVSVSTSLSASLFAIQASALNSEQVWIKAEMEKESLLYFTENANPDTGLIRDKADSFELGRELDSHASISATGFGLAVIANAASRGLLDHSWAEQYFDRTMHFCQDHVPRQHGWFIHWLDWSTGAVTTDYSNDYSTLDTSFLIAGALYAAEIFPNSEGAKIAKQLYLDLDYQWVLTDGGADPKRLTISAGYKASGGFIPYQYSIYAEQMILVLLGIGHPTHPISAKAWYQWERRPFEAGGYKAIALDMPIFIHQYYGDFVDLRPLDDGYPSYFDNSLAATLSNRAVANNDQEYVTLRNGYWGFSAGQAPVVHRASFDKTLPETYSVYSPLHHISTVCIGCAIASAQFAPDVVLTDAYKWRTGPNGAQIWGRYGFTDSIDLDQNFISSKTLGITVGAAYLSLANTDPETSIWRVFNNLPEIQNAMKRIEQEHNRLPVSLVSDRQ